MRFNDVHYSRHKLVEAEAGAKVAWLVTDSELNFIEDKSEWTGTTIRFDISKAGGQTKLDFTHVGLVPEIECFTSCSKGWNYYLSSLVQLIETGKGQPHC